MRALSIDPGVRGSGYAVFNDGALEDCGCVRGTAADQAKDLMLWVPWCERVILERMVHYPRQKSSMPNDLIAVSETGSFLAGAMRPSEMIWVAPQEWKGGVPKHIHHARIRKKLRRIELYVLGVGLESTIKSHHKEVLDACGIGLWGADR